MFFESEWQHFKVASFSSLIQLKTMRRSHRALHSSNSAVIGIVVKFGCSSNPAESGDTCCRCGLCLLACRSAAHGKTCEILDDPFACYTGDGTGSGNVTLLFLAPHELCYGPKDSLWFSLSCFPDIQNDTKAQSVHSHKHIKSFPLLFSTALVAA